MRRLYSSVRKKMGPKYKGNLSKFAFKITNKPIIKKDKIPPEIKFPNNEKGGLIISADFEMAWAWRYTKTGADCFAKGRRERENFPQIIKILEKNNIPITFATVGHLLLEKCTRGDHEWMAKISHFDDHWKFTSGDWYDYDPYSDYETSPEWYAPDLVQMIKDSTVDHEIGTHTFSHIDFSNKNCLPEVADDEIKACIDAAKKFDVKIESIVFPGGTWGNIEVLKKHNFTIYRKRNNFDMAYPYRDDFGLLVTTSSRCLEYDLDYGWSAEYFLDRLKKYINKAIATNTIAHLWFHPSLDPFILYNIFPGILSYSANLREKGLLWIGTMRDIASHINQNKVI